MTFLTNGKITRKDRALAVIYAVRPLFPQTPLGHLFQVLFEDSILDIMAPRYTDLHSRPGYLRASRNFLRSGLIALMDIRPEWVYRLLEEAKRDVY